MGDTLKNIRIDEERQELRRKRITSVEAMKRRKVTETKVVSRATTNLPRNKWDELARKAPDPD